MPCKLAASHTQSTGCGDDTAAPTTGVPSRSQPAHPAHEHNHQDDPDDQGDQDNRVERVLAREPPDVDPREADLREPERLFRMTFDRAAIGIAHTSPEGHWLRVNQRLCDLLGYDCAELTAHTFQDVTYPDDLPATLAVRRSLLAGEVDAHEWDKRYVRKDGTLVWVHLTITLVRTPEGAPDYFITMVQDITERKQLEQERAHLLERERAARVEVEMARVETEAAHVQLQALQALTDTALSHLALDELLQELLDRVTAVMGVDHVAILLLEADGHTLTARAVRGLGEAYVGWVQLLVGQGFAGHIAASRAPLIKNDLATTDLDGAPPILRERLRAVVGVPLLVECQKEDTEDPLEDHAMGREHDTGEGRLVGVLGVGSTTARRFSEADVQLLQRAADRVALAIDRARLYAAEHDARQQAEAAQAEATVRAEQLHTILDTMADGVAVYDSAGRPVQVNRAYRELYTLARAPAGFDTLPARDRVGLLQVRDAATGAPLLFEATPVGRALRGEVVTGPAADIRVRAFDGRELLVNNSAAPLRDREPNGRIVGAVMLLRDLTERDRMERERAAARADELAAREASRRLEAFLAVAAHDLRSPLTAVVGFLDLAEHASERLASAVETAREAYPELAPSVEAVRSRLGDAGQGAERLARQLNRLFDLAAIRADRLELSRAQYDLAALVREQVAAQRVAAPGRTIRLHLPADGGPIPIEADAARIDQVVTNYLTNALKYAPPDLPVDVSIEMQGSRVRVAVRDQGPGIPKAERARVWEQFHRAPEVMVQRGAPGGAESGSLGLGLYICKVIVAAHGGRVGVESVVGAGSTFWFTLPVSKPLSKPLPRPVARSMSVRKAAGGAAH